MKSLQFQNQKAFFSERRILYFILLVVLSAVAPWYLVACAFLLGFLFFEMYAEGVLLALVFDVVYGSGSGMLSGFILSFGALFVYFIFFILDLQPFAHIRNEV